MTTSCDVTVLPIKMAAAAHAEWSTQTELPNAGVGHLSVDMISLLGSLPEAAGVVLVNIYPDTL